MYYFHVFRKKTDFKGNTFLQRNLCGPGSSAGTRAETGPLAGGVGGWELPAR